MQNEIEKWTFFVLVFVLGLGPWMQGVFEVLGFDSFQNHKVVDMIVDMVIKIPRTFWTGALYFVIVPFVLLFMRKIRRRFSIIVYYFLLKLAPYVSVMSLIVCMSLPSSSRLNSNAVGEVFVLDLLYMFMWQVVLIINQEISYTSIIFGPLFALSMHLGKEPPRYYSITTSVLVLYLTIGGLYKGYSRQNGDIFEIDVPLSEWTGLELYSGISIIYSFILICSSIPFPKSIIEFLEVCLYLILLNGNVAAAWICMTGFVRREPKKPYVIIQMKN